MGNKLKDTIRLIRESKGYSQEWVANKLNLTQQGYCALEKSPENATLKRLKELSKILDIRLSLLIEEIDSKNISFKKPKKLSDLKSANFLLLSDTEKNIYERFICELKDEIEFLKKVRDVQ